MQSRPGADAVSNFDPETLAFYAREAESYAGVRPEAVSQYLVGFLERLPRGASILELGCGGGIDAAYMIDAGFAVDPTDGVPEMAAQAQVRLGRPVRVLRFEELEAVKRYDAVVANASLLHVPRAGLTDILSCVWRALKPGGWHLASYKSGGDDGYDEFGRYYNRPSASQAREFYAAAGDWCHCEVEESFEQGHFGKPSTWVTITAQKSLTA